MKDSLDQLKFHVFEFVVLPQRDVILPDFKGNAFRGALGKYLRRLTCAFKTQNPSCNDCLIRDQCIYSRVMESYRIKAGLVLGNVDNAPHPFVLYVPDKHKLEYKRDHRIHFYLTLIGEAVAYIPYFILTFEEIGTYGIGNTRSPFVIEKVLCSNVMIYNRETKTITRDFPGIRGSDFLKETGTIKSLTLELETPLRLKFNGSFQKRITFEMVVRNLLRRIQLLSALYCEGPEIVDFKDLIERSKTIRVRNSSIYWEQQSRFSFRQEKHIGMGGVSGRIAFEGNLEPFMPFLRIGEYLHVGKGTAFGLGKYRIVEETLPAMSLLK
ncbi:MAG: CRISPR system precrRNA processing endoribonuclease RAMP protein Cas6 [Candidatus Omnitrophota bacterium]